MQTDIKIELNNDRGPLPADTAQAIEDALVAVNGKSKRNYQITCCNDVTNAVRVADYVLQQGVADCQSDAVVTYRPAGPWMGAEGKARSTEIVLKRIGRVWHLASIDRVDVWPGDEEILNVHLADRTRH